jgi:hypothetical protein
MIFAAAVLVLATSAAQEDAGPVADPPPPPPVVEAPPPPPVVEAPPPPPAVVAPAPLPFSAGYKDGFFVATTDDRFLLRVRGLVQPRFTIAAGDLDVATWELGFAIRRAQMEFNGYAFTKDLAYAVRVESQLGAVFFTDAFVDYAVQPGVLQLRAGQYKKPFARQELTSDWKIAFAERSITNGFFGAGRDIGAMAHAGIEKSPPLEWAVGVFSGTKPAPSITGDVAVDPTTGLGTITKATITNTPKLFTPTFVGRVGYNHGDVKGYSEMDTGGGGLRFAVAASVLEAIELADASRGATKAEVDAIVKAYGFDASGAAYVALAQEGVGSFDQGYDAFGAHVQAGYLILERFHPGVRYDYIQTADDAVADQHEITAGHSLLFFGENVAWIVDASLLLEHTPADLAATWRARTQINLAF